ncbi:hypothetical protein ACIPVK_16270 [Paeniglutamicibacter sp. MACA_103]|uniref:hypothetical protein n=1 Tax=Paeniglutamicibacter sp. MACA_103 TaxID=3377337 RepID=UPI0038963D25
MSDHYADHQPIPHGILLKWPSLCEGAGRWAVLHDLEGPAGVLFHSQANGMGFLPFRATPISLATTMGYIQASNTEGSSPERVFDYWAGSGSVNRYAGPIHTTEDLGAVADWVNEHNAEPPADMLAP